VRPEPADGNSKKGLMKPKAENGKTQYSKKSTRARPAMLRAAGARSALSTRAGPSPADAIATAARSAAFGQILHTRNQRREQRACHKTNLCIEEFFGS
jgi:hypothetical protein